jgi:iron complex outermembrane receptor protein
MAPLGAAAEEAGARRTIEEIVVTARKREESAQEVPVAITAISKELRNATIRDLVDLNGFAPNVLILEGDNRAGGGGNLNIRGISPTRTDDNSFDPPIGVMIDGIYLGSLAGQVLENFDLERVEILRGPQGTLFGKNTVGGVVNVIRSRPTGEFGARLRATFGNDGQQEYRAVANAPIIEDKLALKVFGTFQKDDGFIDNVTTGKDFGDKDYTNFGATLLFTPNDRFEALFTAEKFNDKSRLNFYHTNYNVGPGVIEWSGDPKDANYSGGLLTCTFYPDTCRTSIEPRKKNAEADTDNDAKLETEAYTLNMSYDLNDNMTLVSVTGYREMYEYRIYDLDGSAAPWITIERWNDYDQFSQELRIDGSWENFSVSGGVYYFKNKFEQDWITAGEFWGTLFADTLYNQDGWESCQNLELTIVCDRALPNALPAGSPANQILYEQQDTISTAFFFQADWQFATDWTLTAGLRWTEETKDFTAAQAVITNDERALSRPFFDYAELDNRWTEFSPKIGLTYQLNDTSIIYASYSEGFHSGGFFGVNQNIRDFERDQYDPETSDSYEMGLKSLLLDNTLRLNITAFYNEFDDKQESFVAIDPDTRTVKTQFNNVASATYWGVEAEAEYAVNQYLTMFLNYGHLDAEYDEYICDLSPNDPVEDFDDCSFLTPRNAPENTIGVGGTVTIPLGQGDIEIYGKYTWIDERETSLLNDPNTNSDALEDLSASVGYYTENWSISVFGRNLTDDVQEVFNPLNPLFATGILNRGLSYGAELTFEF